MSDTSPTKNSGPGLTRADIIGSGAVSNTPGSRTGIQGISLTPARSIASAGPTLGSSKLSRERYQSAYTSRLGPPTLSAPNINRLSPLTLVDKSGDGSSPRRANLSSLKLSPRRASADPSVIKRELLGDENSTVGRIDTPRRGSDVVGSSLQRKLNVEQTGYRRSPVNVSLTRTHSDIEYSRTLRNKARHSLATYLPTSPISDLSGNGDSVIPDSGYNSPRNTEKFTYSLTPSSNSVLPSGADSPNYPKSCQSDPPKINTAVSEGLDTTDSGDKAVKETEKTRYDSGYHSPRYDPDIDSVANSAINIQEESSSKEIQAISNLNTGRNTSNSDSGKYSSKADQDNKTSKDTYQSEVLESSPKSQSVSRATNLEPTPEHSVLVSGLDRHPSKGTESSSEMYTSRKKPEINRPAPPLSLAPGVGDISTEVPTPQPRMRRRLTKKKSFKHVEDDEYIGFASLPEQVHRKAVRRGFEFTLMVVGETGLGKSTLINSLFLTDLYKDRKVSNTEERLQKTVGLEKKELEIEERGVRLKLTIVDTPGFNDAINAEESWKPITNYVDQQFEAYFKAESGLNRKNIKDTRVHCCLYFISPYGHGLRPADVLVMKKLHNKVNIVPLIAKSDILTKQECKKLKDKILEEIERHRIRIYQFPDCDSDEDEEFKQQDQELKASIPFAVVGSNTVVEAGGKKIRGRMYPWGIVEVENPKHCDFTRLRQMLISTHMQDLKDVTCDIHYENYRAEHISEQMGTQHKERKAEHISEQMGTQHKERKAEHISEQMGTQHKERNKLKRDSTPNMEAVLETDKLLQQKEAEIQRMKEMMRQMEAKIRQSQNSPQMNGRVGHV